MFEPIPRFRVIIDRFKEMILSGQLRAGDTLPSVRDVAKTYGVAHETAARAMRELQAEGFAYVSGKTTLVANRGQAHVTLRIPIVGKRKLTGDTFPPEAPAPSPEDVSRVVPPVYVNRMLSQDDGEEVVRRERVDFSRGAPARLTVRWYPVSLVEQVPELLDEDPVRGQWASIDYEIEVSAGRTMEAGLKAFHARTADEREAGHLRISVGAPVLAVVETFADREGTVLYEEKVYPVGVVVMLEFLDSLASLDDQE